MQLSLRAALVPRQRFVHAPAICALFLLCLLFSNKAEANNVAAPVKGLMANVFSQLPEWLVLLAGVVGLLLALAGIYGHFFCFKKNLQAINNIKEFMEKTVKEEERNDYYYRRSIGRIRISSSGLFLLGILILHMAIERNAPGYYFATLVGLVGSMNAGQYLALRKAADSIYKREKGKSTELEESSNQGQPQQGARSLLQRIMDKWS